MAKNDWMRKVIRRLTQTVPRGGWVHEYTSTQPSGPRHYKLGYQKSYYLPNFATRETIKGVAAGCAYVHSPLPDSVVYSMGEERYCNAVHRMTYRGGNYYEAHDEDQQLIIDAMLKYVGKRSRNTGRVLGWAGVDTKNAMSELKRVTNSASVNGMGKILRTEADTYSPRGRQRSAPNVRAPESLRGHGFEEIPPQDGYPPGVEPAVSPRPPQPRPLPQIIQPEIVQTPLDRRRDTKNKPRAVSGASPPRPPPPVIQPNTSRPPQSRRREVRSQSRARLRVIPEIEIEPPTPPTILAQQQQQGQQQQQQQQPPSHKHDEYSRGCPVTKWVNGIGDNTRTEVEGVSVIPHRRR